MEEKGGIRQDRRHLQSPALPQTPFAQEQPLRPTSKCLHLRKNDFQLKTGTRKTAGSAGCPWTSVGSSTCPAAGSCGHKADRISAAVTRPAICCCCQIPNMKPLWVGFWVYFVCLFSMKAGNLGSITLSAACSLQRSKLCCIIYASISGSLQATHPPSLHPEQIILNIEVNRVALYKI